MNLFSVDLHRVIAAAYEHRAQLVLGAGSIELSVILELKQKLQLTAYAEFLAEAPLRCDVHTFGAPGMAAATVRPIKRPKPLGRRALLQQQLALVIEDQQ